MNSIIADYYAAFNAGDWERMLAFLAEGVVHEINEGQPEIGQDAFRAFLQRMETSYREQVKELVIFSAPDARRAAAEFFIDGEYLATDAGLPEASGQRYWLRVGAFFELESGKIARITNHYNLQDWLRQIGA